MKKESKEYKLTAIAGAIKNAYPMFSSKQIDQVCAILIESGQTIDKLEAKVKELEDFAEEHF